MITIGKSMQRGNVSSFRCSAIFYVRIEISFVFVQRETVGFALTTILHSRLEQDESFAVEHDEISFRSMREH